MRSLLSLLVLASAASARPAHLKALADYAGPELPMASNACTVCHLPGGDDEDKPHNAFGTRVAEWRKDRKKAGLPNDIPVALDALADEDVDKDGVANLIEILAGHGPADLKDVPTLAERADAGKKLVAVRARRSDYAWEPFKPVTRPVVPVVKNAAWVRNPIDAFVAERHEKLGLTPRPEAAKAVLLRRVYLDLIGVPPTRDELHAFLADTSTNAYEKVVERLLRSPLYGQAQARHWMDVWRYSDWAGFGNEVRDSQPHVWRWRDWIVENLNRDTGYDQLVRQMLAADEIAPDDPDGLRATGFLVRSWYKFSREIVLDRMVEHTGKAFLGITLNCAKCHDHMYDPISQVEHYAFRALFATHEIRTDRVPGQADTIKDGVVHVYDGKPNNPTYLFNRGNDQDPDKSKAIPPAVPAALGGKFEIKPVSLPKFAVTPEDRPFIQAEIRAANEKAAKAAPAENGRVTARLGTFLIGSDGWSILPRLPAVDERAAERTVSEAAVRLAELKRDLYAAHLAVEDLAPKAKPTEWAVAATRVNRLQREQAVATAVKNLADARVARWRPTPKGQPDPAKRIADAEAALVKAEAALKAPPATTFQPRAVTSYPKESSGRRLALANWIADAKNPLTARVAMNHLWLRRFGTGLVPSVFDFGKNGQPPTHPKLLDWLAAEFTARNWSLREMHRLIVLSSAYRMDTGPDAANAARDADNKALWRMNPRRMTAEAVRDSVLAVAGELDVAAGGPELDHAAGMTVKRRSLYFRHAPEKQMIFLELFDAASPTECYRRTESVVPQQALALANSPLVQATARTLAGKVSTGAADDSAFVTAAFETILGRPPSAGERDTCGAFLSEQTSLFTTGKLTPTGGPAIGVAPARDPKQRAREGLVHVLFNHNDFVTVR
jgi:hypothetical protein